MHNLTSFQSTIDIRQLWMGASLSIPECYKGRPNMLLQLTAVLMARRTAVQSKSVDYKIRQKSRAHEKFSCVGEARVKVQTDRSVIRPIGTQHLEKVWGRRKLRGPKGALCELRGPVYKKWVA